MIYHSAKIFMETSRMFDHFKFASVSFGFKPAGNDGHPWMLLEGARFETSIRLRLETIGQNHGDIYT
jgi:hypothetical protein